MKRILLLFSALMLSCIALWAHDVVIAGIYYNLDKTNKTAEVTYRGDDFYDYDDEYLGSVTIPETITYNSEIYSVTSIGYGAFYECTKLKSVTIPSSVTSMDIKAFDGCSGLTKVNYIGTVDKWAKIDFFFPESNPTFYAKNLYINNKLLTEVKITSAYSINDFAFINCQSIKSVEIGNSVTSIGSEAFYNCSGLTSVTIPNSVTYIGLDAFYNTGIYNNNSNWDNGVLYIDNCLIKAKSDVVKGSYTIKKGTRIIGSSAFYECSGLTSVTIPNSVTSISLFAFEGCSGLTKVNYLGSVDKWVEIDFDDYDSNPTTYAKDLYINNELLTDVKITSADSIKFAAFGNCQSIKSVEIGNSVTSIDFMAFYECSGLTSVTIPNSVTSIGDEAFKDCSGLTKVNYLGTVDKWVEIVFMSVVSNPTYYAEDLYINNELLTDVKITSAYSINDFAFINCQSIKSVEIGNSVTSIGSEAFYNCSGLTSVTIPNSVTYIGLDAFYNTGIYNNNSNWDNGVLYIDNCLIKAKSDVVKGSYTIKKGTRIIGSSAFYECSGLTSVTIPNSVTSIGDDAFYNCSELTKVNYLGTVDKWVEIDFDDYDSNPTYYADDLYINYELLTDVKITTADSIKDYAFGNCQSIKSVEIGNSVTSIGSSAFSGCSGLTSVTIGESVTSIDEYAFSGCDKLKKVTAYPTTVPNAYESSFEHYNAYLYVPCDVYEDYDLDDVFGNFEYIKCIAAEEDEPTSITETLADANITVSGGTISADADFSIYNTIGQDVTAFNGSLQPGVYLVSIENNIVKVMVH